MRTSAGLFALAGWLSSGLAVADEPAAPVPPSVQSPCPPPAETTPSNCVPAWVIDASGVRQLPDRCLEPVAAADTAALSAPSVDDPCDPPTFVDAHGIQRVRPLCLAGSPSPAPAALSAPPILSAPPKLAAPPTAATPAPTDRSCDDSPTFVDAHGIRRVRPVCLAGSPAPAPAATPPAAAPPVAAAQSSAGESCDPPWYLDARGIRRLRVDCL